MKVLTATTRTQGLRDNDFSHTIDGEILVLGIVCDRDDGDPDSDCGCGRSLIGVTSRRATTTAEVTDVEDLDLDTYRKIIRDALDPAIWWDDDVDEMAADLAAIAARHDVGAVLGRRGDEIEVRDTDPSDQRGTQP